MGQHRLLEVEVEELVDEDDRGVVPPRQHQHVPCQLTISQLKNSQLQNSQLTGTVALTGLATLLPLDPSNPLQIWPGPLSPFCVYGPPASIDR